MLHMSTKLLNTKLNPICHLLALLRAHHFLHISRVRVKILKSLKYLVIFNLKIVSNVRLAYILLILTLILACNMSKMTFETQTAEYIDVSTIDNFLKTYTGGNWSLKMVFIFCTNTVYK